MDDPEKKGFSLIEAAIVLGVVGLVIGGIWVAAATVREEWKISRLFGDIQLIVNKAQNLISSADSRSIGSVNITSQLQSANVFPGDWSVFSAAWVKSSFGDYFQIINSSGGATERFIIRSSGVKLAICIKLTTRISAAANAIGAGGYYSTTSLQSVTITNSGGGSSSWSTFPISVSSAKGACSATNNTVDFYFGYSH